jgi:hypothetical protein
MAETAIETPNPIRYYRIDGTTTFRKTRFLHLDLDIEIRTPLASEEFPQPAAPPYDVDATNLGTRAPAYQVSTIHQSRQVQIQDMEYFDGPVFSVLTYVTRVGSGAEDESGQ